MEEISVRLFFSDIVSKHILILCRPSTTEHFLFSDITDALESINLIALVIEGVLCIHLFMIYFYLPISC